MTRTERCCCETCLAEQEEQPGLQQRAAITRGSRRCFFNSTPTHLLDIGEHLLHGSEIRVIVVIASRRRGLTLLPLLALRGSFGSGRL